MQLVKTSFYSAIATVSKMLSGLIISKVIALKIGPSGLALIGQFQNFIQLTMTIAQGAINTGVTKYVAEHDRKDPQLPALLSTAMKISLTTSAITGIFIILLSKQFSQKILNSADFQYVFVIFGFTITLYVIDSLFLSIVNGLKEIEIWGKISIIQNFYSLIFTTLLIYFFGLDGSLIAIATNQSVIFLALLFMLRNNNVFVVRNFLNAMDWGIAKNLLRFSTMQITSAVLAPVTALILRSYLTKQLSIVHAGYWQAIVSISAMYLMVIVSMLNLYFLPQYSSIKEKSELKKEIFRGIKIILPLVVVLSLSIYILRTFIVEILFSKEFAPVAELFQWQLVGDFFKILSWIFANIMWAKAMTKEFILSEIIFSIFLLALTLFCVERFDLVGVTYAYAVCYIVYFVTVIFITKKEWS